MISAQIDETTHVWTEWSLDQWCIAWPQVRVNRPTGGSTWEAWFPQEDTDHGGQRHRRSGQYLTTVRLVCLYFVVFMRWGEVWVGGWVGAWVGGEACLYILVLWWGGVFGVLRYCVLLRGVACRVRGMCGVCVLCGKVCVCMLCGEVCVSTLNEYCEWIHSTVMPSRLQEASVNVCTYHCCFTRWLRTVCWRPRNWRLSLRQRLTSTRASAGWQRLTLH